MAYKQCKQHAKFQNFSNYETEIIYKFRSGVKYKEFKLQSPQKLRI
jgi:hypothetical protein